MLRADFTLKALGSMKESILAALRQDTAAISAVRCLHLYLERLEPDQDGPRITQARPTCSDTLSVAPTQPTCCMQHFTLLNYYNLLLPAGWG